MVKVEGVHWGWWLFWLIVFWPGLLFVWLKHSNKIREAERHNQLVIAMKGDK